MEPAPESAASIGVRARLHLNVQTSDFKKARAFYHALGFTDGQTGLPTAGSHLMARALGMRKRCGYELVARELMTLPSAIKRASIDLIQFRAPFEDSRPYASPTHLGIAYAALLSTDLGADVAVMKARGVEFLSEPYGVPGFRFVFFKDPDGVLYKLVETAPPHGARAQATTVAAVAYVGINVSDFDRSYDFYRDLGYSETLPLAATGTPEEAAAYGLDRAFRIRGAQMTLPDGDYHAIRLVQWLEPADDRPPYPPPINHIGLHHVAIEVADLDHAVRILASREVEFLSEIVPCCSGTGLDQTGIVHVVDPDGTFIRLVGPIARRPAPEPPPGCPKVQHHAPTALPLYR